MSVSEDTSPDSMIESLAPIRAKESALSKFVDFISSVRFGIILLILLVVLCVTGMLIRQHNVAGFQSYYAELVPWKQIIFSTFGLFDIYHSWYFNALLSSLSLNIILASYARFPKTWAFVSKPKLNVSAQWLLSQQVNCSFTRHGTKKEIRQHIVNACKKAGWRKVRISEKDERTFVFAESGAWNRLGAYPVHFALLTIFFGGFLTSQFSFSSEMPLNFGQSSDHTKETSFQNEQVVFVNRQLPFVVTCTDLQQKLIDREGSIDVANSLDWITHLQITDEYGTHDGIVQLNHPFDYRGYRFFHSDFLAMGKARKITIEATSSAGQKQNLTIERNGTTTLPDGTKIRFVDFRANFSSTRENRNENSTNYQNPTAILEVKASDTPPETAYVFGKRSRVVPLLTKSTSGYTFALLDFEKVAERHILVVQRDPGANIVYFGFALLFLSLIAVFFFSHQRIWSIIEETSENRFNVIIGGNSNRNEKAFSDRFRRFIIKLQK